MPDGWLYTGDIGTIDDDGFLRITDRKKDLFKTSQGKYVAPSAIAAAFKAICPYASEMIVYGDAMPYCVALVSLDTDAITDWAAKNGLENLPFPEIARHQSDAGVDRRVRRHPQRAAQPVGADQEVHHPRPRVVGCRR